MVVVPADEQGINTEQKINDAAISATHKNIFLMNDVINIETSNRAYAGMGFEKRPPESLLIKNKCTR